VLEGTERGENLVNPLGIEHDTLDASRLRSLDPGRAIREGNAS
jgi:hypothetical protein